MAKKVAAWPKLFDQRKNRKMFVAKKVAKWSILKTKVARKIEKKYKFSYSFGQKL